MYLKSYWTLKKIQNYFWKIIIVGKKVHSILKRANFILCNSRYSLFFNQWTNKETAPNILVSSYLLVAVILIHCSQNEKR